MNVVPFPHMLQIVYRDGLSLYPCMIIPYYLNLLHHTAMPMLSVDCSPDPPVLSETVFLLDDLSNAQFPLMKSNIVLRGIQCYLVYYSSYCQAGLMNQWTTSH